MNRGLRPHPARGQCPLDPISVIGFTGGDANIARQGLGQSPKV